MWCENRAVVDVRNGAPLHVITLRTGRVASVGVCMGMRRRASLRRRTRDFVVREPDNMWMTACLRRPDTSVHRIHTTCDTKCVWRRDELFSLYSARARNACRCRSTNAASLSLVASRRAGENGAGLCVQSTDIFSRQMADRFFFKQPQANFYIIRTR